MKKSATFPDKTRLDSRVFFSFSSPLLAVYGRERPQSRTIGRGKKKEMKEEPAPNKKDDDVPDPLTVSDEEQQEDEPVDTVLLHAATLSMAIDHLPANVGQWRRIIEQHYRRATLKFHLDKGGSEELFDQLDKAKAYLFEWAAKWVVLDKAFPKLSKLCYCAKCTHVGPHVRLQVVLGSDHKTRPHRSVQS